MSHLGERLSALIDGELGHDQRDRVLAHLARCEACRLEAAALRLLKRRMRTLGEATAAAALTDRLMAMAPSAGGGPALPPRGEPGGVTMSRWPVRSLALSAFMVLALGLPAAAFLAGGKQAEPGPSVTPAVQVYLTQHAITTGAVPAAVPEEEPSTGATPGPVTSGTGPATGLGAAGAAARSLAYAKASESLKRSMSGTADVSRPPNRRDHAAPRTQRGSHRPAGRRLVAPRGG